MAEYKANSHRSKEVAKKEEVEVVEKKKVEKITSGTVKTKKKK